MSDGDGIASKIVVGVVVAVIAGLILAYLQPRFGLLPDDLGFGDDEATENADPGPTVAPVVTQAPTPTQGPTPTEAPPPTQAPEAETDPPTNVAGCVVTIENPLVTAFEQPDMFGLEVGNVPPGTYEVLEIRVVTFAGSPDRWFRVPVGGTSGWVLDSSILIASKSSGCQ